LRDEEQRPQLEIITEHEVWHRLGVLDSEADARRLCTPPRLAELVGASINDIRRWQRRGLLVPARELHRLAYFDFGDVAVARRLRELGAAGASNAAIERMVLELK
jgi:hypothetical protein